MKEMPTTPKPELKLKDCPSCGFTREDHAKHVSANIYATPWENYAPKIYREPLFNNWVAECSNCGMAVLFNMTTEGETVELWNKLPRPTRELIEALKVVDRWLPKCPTRHDEIVICDIVRKTLSEYSS